MEEPETEEPSEEPSGEAEEAEADVEDIDLDSELAALDLDDEEEKQEESFENRFEGNYLLEQLQEETDIDLEVSDTEFEELINRESPDITAYPFSIK
jgi:hypothetical protein